MALQKNPDWGDLERKPTKGVQHARCLDYKREILLFFHIMFVLLMTSSAFLKFYSSIQTLVLSSAWLVQYLLRE